MQPPHLERSPPAEPPPPRRRRLVFAAITAIVAFLIALALAEVGIRLAGHRPREETVNGYFFVADPKLGWRNRAGATYSFTTFGSTVHTGPRGERLGVRSSPDPTGATVLFVGDSTTFCAEVDDEATGPSEVAKLLSPEKAPFVVNAGVRAYGTVQAVRMAEEWLARAPIKVVVYTYADNDWVENVDPIVSLPCWAPQAIWAGGGLSIKDPPEPPTGWGQPLDDESVLASDRRLLLKWARRSAAAELVAEHVRLAVRVRELDDGAFGPIGTPDQWARAVAWATEHHAHDVIAALVQELDAACKAHGASLLVTRFTTHGASAALDPTTLGVPGLDLASFFSAEPRSYMARTKSGGFDAHYGPLGTKTYAAAIAPRIAELLAGH